MSGDSSRKQIFDAEDNTEGCVGAHGGDWSEKLPFDEDFNLYDLDLMNGIPDVLVDLGDLTNDFATMCGSEKKLDDLPTPQETKKELNTTSIDWSQIRRYDEELNLHSVIEQVGLPEVLVDLGDLTSDFEAMFGPENKFDDLPAPRKRKDGLNATSMCDKKLKVGSSQGQNLTDPQGVTTEEKPQGVLKKKNLNQMKTVSAESGVKDNVGKVFDQENNCLSGKDHEKVVEQDKDDED